MDSPLKFHGGKSYLAKKIIALMPPRCLKPNSPDNDDTGYIHYVEPFAGGLSVLLANDPEGISEVANDLDGDLTNFWSVLSDQHGAFQEWLRYLQATPFAEFVYRASLENNADPDKVRRAAFFFVRCRQSLAGRMDTFAPTSRNRTRRGMNEQVSAWLNAVEGLPKVHERLSAF